MTPQEPKIEDWRDELYDGCPGHKLCKMNGLRISILIKQEREAAYKEGYEQCAKDEGN